MHRLVTSRFVAQQAGTLLGALLACIAPGTVDAGSLSVPFTIRIELIAAAGPARETRVGNGWHFLADVAAQPGGSLPPSLPASTVLVLDDGREVRASGWQPVTIDGVISFATLEFRAPAPPPAAAELQWRPADGPRRVLGRWPRPASALPF